VKSLLLALCLVPAAHAISRADGLALLKKIPATGYANRAICVKGNNVWGLVPPEHWRLAGGIATGTVASFPRSVVPAVNGVAPFTLDHRGRRVIGVDGTSTFYVVKGKLADGRKADLCVYEVAPVFE